MSTDLIILPSMTPAVIFTKDGTDDVLSKIKERARSMDRDISTEKGRDNIRSLAYQIARSKTALDDMGKDLVAGEKARIASIDAERKRMRDELDALKEEIRAPLTEWEDAEKKRIEEHEFVLGLITASNTWMDERGNYFIPTSEQVKERLDKLPALYQREWQEFRARAISEHERIKSGMIMLHGERKKHENEQAELARLRAEQETRDKKEREDKIAADATKAAEDKAELARIAAEEKAAADLKKAEDDKAAEKARADKAEADKEQSRINGLKCRLEELENRKFFAVKKPHSSSIAARIESLKDFDGTNWQEYQEAAVKEKLEVMRGLGLMLAEAQSREEEETARAKKESDDAAAQRERDRIAAEQETERKATEVRENDKKHKAKINNEILEALQGTTDSTEITTDVLKKIITAIAQGKVPHVKINY